MERLLKGLRPLRRKLAAEKLLRCLCVSIAVAAGASGLVLLLSKIIYVQMPFLICGMLFAGVVAMGVMTALFKMPSYERAAAVGDSLGFKERFVTAFQILSDGHEATPIELLAVADAVDKAENAALAQKYQMIFPKRAVVWAVTLCIFFAVCGFVPSPSFAAKDIADRQELALKIQGELQQVEEARKSATEKLSEGQANEVNAKIKDIREKVKAAKTEAEAVSTLQKGQEELKRLSERLAENENSLGEAQENVSKAIDNMNEALSKASQDLQGGAALDGQIAGAKHVQQQNENEGQSESQEQGQDQDMSQEETANQSGNAEQSAAGSQGKGNGQNESQGKNNEQAAGENVGGGDKGGSGRGDGSDEDEMIYSREAQNYADYDASLQGLQNEGGKNEQIEQKELGGAGGSIPYASVYGSYRDEALKALDDYEIPSGMQELIKEYFSTLEQ